MNAKKYALKTFLAIEGILLVYTGIMLSLSTKGQILEMIAQVKIKGPLPIPFGVILLSFLFNGAVFLAAVSDRFLSWLTKRSVAPLALRAFLIFTSFVLVFPALIKIPDYGSINWLNPALPAGLAFPGGLLVHLVFQHWLGGLLGFTMAAKPMLFSGVRRVAAMIGIARK